MDPITIALTAAKFLPGLVRLFKGPSAENVANQVLDVAKQVTGHPDPETAMQQIESDPTLKLKFIELMNPILEKELEEDTKRLQTVNDTMRVEYQTQGLWKSGWRPWFGWVAGTTWGIQAISFVVICIYAIVADPANAFKTIDAMAQLAGAMTIVWGIALSVLGVNITKRSQDKQVAAGQEPFGLLQMLLGKK